ncbi:MAG: DUF2959 family protein [Parvularculaceae bacterium]
MVRTLTIAAMALAAAGCASAVYDSLERRGVDAKTVLIERVTDAGEDASAAADAIDAAGNALAGARGLDGPGLSRQIGSARASAQGAALAAQDLRLSADTAKAAGARYFREWEEEIGLYETPTEREAATARLKAQSSAHRSFLGAIDSAGLALSPALTLITDEIDVLRKNPTSGVVVASRAARIDAARRAATDASAKLRSAAAEAGGFLAAVK